MPSSPFPKLIALASLFLICSEGGIRAQGGEVTPARCWTYDAAEVRGTRLAIDAARIFVGYQGGRIEALSADGKRVWSSEFGGEISSNILAAESGIALITSSVSEGAEKSSDATIRLLSKETGITAWSVKLPMAERHFLGTHMGTIIVVSANGVIQALDAESGSVKWKREIADGFVAEPVFNGTKLTIAGRAKQVFLVSMATGELESMRKSEFDVTALGETALGTHVTGDTRGNVTSFANGTEKPSWRFKTGGEISGLSPIGDSLLVTSHDNFVYLLTSKKGGVAWKRRLAGRVSHLITLSNRYIFASATEENGITITDAANGKAAAQIGFAEGESLVHDPIVMGDRVLLMTDRAIYAYSIGACK